MKKFYLENGLIAYETTALEITLIGGLGMCDECGKKHKSHEHGYLVPVLNHWMCKDCFADWKCRCRNYPEDARIETRNAKYYECLIPLDV